MGIRIVRQSTETPNVVNVDDITAFRYAYGNQNGYKIGIGSELSANYENGVFTVGSGHAVIQGADYVVDGNGINTTLDTGVGTRYFKIYLKVNLDTAELASYYSTNGYDNIPEPTSGSLIAGENVYMLLYTLKLDGATQTEISKVVKQIDYNHRRLLWTGNAEIGTTNPSSTMTAFATIPDTENTTYEVHGEIPTGGTKETFVIHVQIGEYNESGYLTEQIVGSWMTNSLMQFKKVEIHRNGNFFYGRALMPTLYFSNHSLVYNEITARITKIYEIK